MAVSDPSLHLQSGGEGLKLNKAYLRTRKLDLDRINLSSIRIKDLKSRRCSPLAGAISSGRNEKGA
jgi:hypothetical protein